LTETKAKYVDGLQEVNQVKDQLLHQEQNTIDSMKVVLQNVKIKASVDSADFSATIARTADGINAMAPAAQRVKQAIESAERVVSKINEQVQRLDREKVKFGIGDVFAHVTPFLQIVAGLVMITPILFILLLIFRKRPNIHSR
jgi:hypothetical protein